VSSLISRYVSKKWLMKKGSRFTWPGSQRTRASAEWPSQLQECYIMMQSGLCGHWTCLQWPYQLPRTLKVTVKYMVPQGLQQRWLLSTGSMETRSEHKIHTGFAKKKKYYKISYSSFIVITHWIDTIWDMELHKIDY
jgi:hypothetical protein